MTRLATDGYELLPGFYSEERIDTLRRESECDLDHRIRKAGSRNLGSLAPAVRTLRNDPRLVELASSILGAPAFVVRTLFFDKTPEANWKVAWHQDLTICVCERREVDSFGPWSLKDGIQHVQPPASVLSCMVTLRVHLDDCTEANGALRVIPGSHASGRLSAEAIQRVRATQRDVTCEIPAGGVLVMRPLLLHASSPALVPSHRRVLHLEWASEPLPGGLEWFERTLDI